MKASQLSKHSLSLFVSMILVLAVSILSSCTTRNRLLSSWVDPAVAASGQKVEDTLVIGVARDATIRRLFERSVAKGLQREGVNTFQGNTVEAVKDTINKESVLKACQDVGAKTVLITRLLDVSTITTTGDALGRKYEFLDDAQINYGVATTVADPVTTDSETLQYKLESRLYDVKTRKLLWSAITEVTDPVMTNAFIDSATALYIEDLKKNKLL